MLPSITEHVFTACVTCRAVTCVRLVMLVRLWELLGVMDSDRQRRADRLARAAMAGLCTELPWSPSVFNWGMSCIVGTGYMYDTYYCAI